MLALWDGVVFHSYQVPGGQSRMCHRDDIPGRGWGSLAEQTPMLQPFRPS